MVQEYASSNTTGAASPHISAAKRALLAKYLRGELAEQSASPRSIPPRPPGAIPQLSFAQERLWFLDQLNPESALYNVPLAVRLSGPLNPKTIEQSVNEIVRRHESLRTTFLNVEGQPFPVVAPHLEVELQIRDLSLLPKNEREASAQLLLYKEAATPFDLAHGPLIRTTLVKLSDHQYVFLLVMHHITSDGWSLVLFFKELSAIYEAIARGEQSPLPDLEVQYADYAAWQREWLQGDVLERQLSYWTRQLGGELPVLQLPTDRPRPAMQTFSGAREWLILSEALTTSLLALSQRESVTLFITLLAGFKTLLHRYTGDDDIIVGSPIANRPQTETESIVGFFLNNLALRSDLSGNPNFRETLARVRKTALEAYAHQDVPFEKLIEALKPERDLSRTPIFQVYFNLFNFADEIKLPGSERTVSFVEAWEQSEEALSKFDLTLYAGLQNGELKLAFVYNTDLFDAATITQMLAHFQKLLAEIVADPDCGIADFSLRDEVESDEKSLLSHGVRPVNPFVEFRREEIEQSITQRFATQVAKYSDRLAVSSKNYKWSYKELDAAVHSISQTLADLRGHDEERVALLFEHDAPMVAAMLGALEAGKTYVPLDPASPAQRLVQIIEHSQATLVLTNNRNLALARDLATRANSQTSVVNIDDANPVAETVELPAVAPDRLAYILYTSGSTGAPKGVMQNHRNVLHYTRVYTNNLHLNADDRLTLLSSYCFDAAVMDIYGALLNGATLYPIDLKQDGLAGLAQQIVDEEITVYHSTPTVYRYFLTSLSEPPASAGGARFLSVQPDFPKVRLVVLGGEKVSKSDVELYQQHFADDCLFVNGLGPTEATVTLQNFIDKQTKIAGESVPVGRAVAETEVLLLNKAGQSTEICGEIAIKSPHVALGYWRNPEATSKAFSVNGRGPNVRIYRTGDMGRRLPDGSIRFEGRKDFQIKIRGFRVELGEIEAALAQYPQVSEGVVVAKENEVGDARLVAYVVLRDEECPTHFSLSPQVEPASSTDDKLKFVGQFREFLKHKLPEYMLPGSFVVLDSLPLTASGKLNRRALPEPDQSVTQTRDVFAAPARPLEKSLTAIWADVLQLKTVGVNDNFFELGGHSLLAVRLFAQIEKRLGKRLPLATLFQAPTVGQLASVIDRDKQADQTPAWSSLVAINPIDTLGSTESAKLGAQASCLQMSAQRETGSRLKAAAHCRQDEHPIRAAPMGTPLVCAPSETKPPFFCVHALGGNVLEYYDLARHLGADQPFYGLQSAGLDSSRPPHTRVEDMAAHYIKELRELQPHGPYFIGGRSLGGMVAFEMAQQLKAQGQSIGLLALLDTYPSGYAKLFRNEATLRAALARGAKRTRAHVANLRQLSVSEGLAYVIKKARFAPRKMKSQVWRRIYQSYENLDRPLPRLLRDIKEFNSLAVRDYAPKVYDGKVTLFWASADLRTSIDLVAGWRALAGGGIEVHEIPGSHLDIVKEPHVGELASKLSACLDRAQSANSKQ
jgi:amino acid adenylation domain-containing protein